MSSLSLPQPPPIESDVDRNQCYKYVPYDVFETDWLGDPRRLQSSMMMKNNNADDENNARYAAGTLVWVLLSKGKPKQPKYRNNTQSGYNALAIHKKRRDKKNKRKNIDETAQSPKEEAKNQDEKNVPSNDIGSQKSNDVVTSYETTLNHSRKEFFIRARVISDDEVLSEVVGGGHQSSAKKRGERRVLVRYSRGATYRVRACNLIPVLEPSVHNNIDALPSTVSSQTNHEAKLQKSVTTPPLVILVPETNIYRRVAKVHTTPDDSFMEIGCDYGITVDKIHKSLEEAGDVPKVWPVEKNPNSSSDDINAEEKGKDDRASCLGIDRSKESIDIANER